METPLITEKEFNRIRKHLPAPGTRKRIDDRYIISGIIWVIKHGASWRQVPEFYGKWTTIYSRFKRWSEKGIFQKIFKYFSSKLKKKCIAMIDSTYTKTHRTAASMASDKQDRKIGRSRGGLTTKIHFLCNDEAKPMDIIITGGEVHDIKVAPELVSRNKMKCLLADKAYGSKKFRKLLADRKIEACIPPKSNSKVKIEYDKQKYKKRHVIENMFARLKDWKGLALRTNRNAHTFLSFVYIAVFTIFF